MEKFQKIVNLIKKTGDKAIILDQNGDPSYVIMGLDDYEKLILGKSEVRGLTESELLDKINRDIAIWKENEQPEITAPDSSIGQHDFAHDPGLFSSFDKAFDASLESMKEPDWSAYEGRYDGDFDEDGGEDMEEDRYYFETVE